MHPRKDTPWGDEAGFTLIELLVAAVVLLVGLMGTLALLNGTSSAQNAARSREGATSLAREVLEKVRGAAYESVTPSVLTATLLSSQGYQSLSGSTATVARRGVRYAVTASVCSIDDPKDGLGTTDASFCSASTPSSPADNQPDDLKRVRVSITWPGKRSTTIAQTAMLSSNGAVIGLPTQTFTMSSPTNIGASATAPIITSASAASAPCPASTGCFTANAPGAKRIIFAVDGADQGGSAVTMDATCSALPCAKWNFAWNYAGLSDGVYRVTARSVDANDVEGLPKSVLVTISKGGRSAPCGVGSIPGDCRPVEGGYNDLPGGPSGEVFEVRWQANPERNVVGYRVQTGTGAAGTGTLVCSVDAQGNVTSPATQTPANAPGLDQYACIDPSPPAPSAATTSYGVYARYSDGATGSIVDGPVSTVGQAGGGSSTTTTYSAPIVKTFGLDNRTSASGCTKDMTDGWAGSGTSVHSGAGPGTITFCTPTMSTLFPTASSVSVQGPVDIATTMELDASGTKRCTLYWTLSQGATTLLTNGAGLSFSGGGDHQTPVNHTNLALSATTAPLNGRLQLALNMNTPGSNCPNANVMYNGTTTGALGNPAPGHVRVRFVTGTTTTVTNTWARPNPPTAVTKAAAGSNTTVSWTGSAGGNVAFYRIYRDGRAYADRYDTCDVGDVTPGCDDNDGTFTYTDESTGGTSHNYWVTAVYGTGSPLASTLAESTQVAAS